MKKINVIGTSGSGKTTFAKKLAQQLGYPYIEMDSIFWGKNWYWPSDEEFFNNLECRLKLDKWVLDGNYSRSTPIKWKEVDTIIWIDYSFPRTLYQAITRALNRSLTKKELWPGTGNRESFGKLFSKDSIVLWTIKTYYKNKAKYRQLAAEEKYKHIEFIRLENPRECQRYLDQFC
ncbi:AAA family ATPase [Spartinivicinus poritis]|uniref:AAA family ATPase n=1 Tax=Spartinivicinus poritis TaxID=2994640 RepID=A0ABT5U4D0_9GAMM|nr:AAA family ATPase [Spartinivicinus sp. A2-2]MDE1461229.1 AAA family ATPase [Spartinivicinus sp. A2-2]